MKEDAGSGTTTVDSSHHTQQLLGTAWRHQQTGELKQAETLYQQILESDPDNPDALHMLGLLMHQSGDSDAGAELVKRAMRGRPDDPRFHCNLALILESRGRIEEAISHNRRALALNPDLSGAKMNLANELRIVGDLDAAVATYQDILTAHPDHPGVWSNLGSALRIMGKPEEAIEAFRKGLALAPENADIHSNLGNALQERGDYAGAVAAFTQAIRFAPGFADAYANLGIACLQAKEPQKALEALDRCLQHDTAHRTALAFRTLALYALGEAESARAVTALDDSVMIRDISAPSGFADRGAFNEALAAHVINHDTARFEPFSKTTRKGRQTGNLLLGEKGPVARLEQLINAAIDAYVERMPFPAGHPYRRVRPARWDLNVWATILDEAGHQAPHIHPGGWLSGVYYVAVPDKSDPRDQSGWIEFGHPPADVPEPPGLDTRLLEPREGMLLVFPSYFFHRTRPAPAGGPRISIAFDAVPTG